jgi:hypothetical protein
MALPQWRAIPAFEEEDDSEELQQMVLTGLTAMNRIFKV